MDLKVVRYEVAERVALVTLDRADRMNAWTGRMHTEYRWVLAEAERDDEVRAIVVTGAGRAFCAGADTTALDGHVERGTYDAGVDHATLARPGYGVRPEFDHAFAFHYGIPKPVIAAINGPAAGVGLVLACYCDIRFAAVGAKLTRPIKDQFYGDRNGGVEDPFGHVWFIATHTKDVTPEEMAAAHG